MAKLELSRTLSISPEDAWGHVANLNTLGDWLEMHQGWRGDVPTELSVGTKVVGVAGAKGLRNRVTWTAKYKLRMTVAELPKGCEFTVNIDLGGRPLFGPVGAIAVRAVKGDIERSIRKFEEIYAR